VADEPLCERIEEYLDECLSPSERAGMKAHIETCEDCRSAVEEYRRLRRIALETPPVDVPDDLAFLIRQRLESRGRRRRARLILPIAFGAAAAAAVLLVAMLPRGVDEPPSPETPVLVADVVPLASDLLQAAADWLVQAGNASPRDGARLLEEARALDLLGRIRSAKETPDEWLTAVSDLLVQLENDPNGGFLPEEARLVAMVRSR
jgi:anti-sigma factor RsiW